MWVNFVQVCHDATVPKQKGVNEKTDSISEVKHINKVLKKVSWLVERMELM